MHCIWFTSSDLHSKTRLKSNEMYKSPTNGRKNHCCLLGQLRSEDLISSPNHSRNRSNKFLHLLTRIMIKSVFLQPVRKGREVRLIHTGHAHVPGYAVVPASSFKHSCTWQWPDNIQVRLTSPTVSEKFSKIITCGGNVIADMFSQTQSHKYPS